MVLLRSVAKVDLGHWKFDHILEATIDVHLAGGKRHTVLLFRLRDHGCRGAAEQQQVRTTQVKAETVTLATGATLLHRMEN